jgi:hypothetical membrane protein
MGPVNPNRLRWGALAWLLTLQFFVVETVAELRYEGSYSRVDDVISALGAADSPARQLMNASFVVQAALIVGGVLLLRPALQRGAGLVARVLLSAAAAGVLLVGVFPTDGNGTAHATGAVLHLVGGGLGLIALAYAVRPRSEVIGSVLAVLGLVGTSATVFFLTGVTGYLGEGGTERAAAYVVPIGLTVAGFALWRMSGRVTVARVDGAAVGDSDTPRRSRREERALARAVQAERNRQRDEALEAVTRSSPGSRADTGEDDDPWAAPGRRQD